MQNFFKSNIEYLKKKNNETYGSIALQVGCSANTVSYWVNKNFEPKMSELEKLFQYFEISIQDLLYLDLENETLDKPNNNMASHSPPDEDYKAKYIALLEVVMQQKVECLVSEVAQLRAELNDIKKQKQPTETKRGVA